MLSGSGQGGREVEGGRGEPKQGCGLQLQADHGHGVISSACSTLG